MVSFIVFNLRQHEKEKREKMMTDETGKLSTLLYMATQSTGFPGSTAQRVRKSERSAALLQPYPAKHTCDQQAELKTETDGVCLS